MKKGHLLGRIAVVVVLLCSHLSYSQLTGTANTNADQLVQEIIGNGAIVVPGSSVLTCPNGAAGTFTDPSSSVGLPEGIMLTTGNVTLYNSGPNEASAAQDNGIDLADPHLTQMEPEAHYDPCYLEFDIIPICDTLKLDYVFASEEYPDYVCSNFNDAFGFFITGPGIAGPFPGGAENIATIPGQNTYVTINTVNGGVIGIAGGAGGCPNGGLNNTQYFVDNSSGTQNEFNGYTVPLTAVSPVMPCETYHMKLVIADAGDGLYDSGVFLAKAGLTCPANTVEWNVTVDNSTEGCSDAVFSLHREGDLTTDLDVVFTFAGTATNGTDYNFINTYNFPVGQTDVDFTLSALDDNLPEGTETVQIIASVDICGILVGDTLDIQIFDEPFADAGPDQNSCGLTFQLAGNNPAPYTGLWTSDAGVTFSNATSPTSSATLPGQGSFDLVWTVTAISGCFISDTVNLSTLGEAEININVVEPECYGDAFTLEALAPDPAGTYTWGLLGPPFTGQQNGPGIHNINYTSSGTVNVGLNIDINGCTADTVFSVVIPEELTILAAGFDPACFNTNDGQATVIPSGGTPNYTYAWSPGGQTMPSINNLGIGDYTITVTDANQCSVDTTFTLTAPPAIEMTYTTVNSNCGFPDGSAIATPTGGTIATGSGYVYSWSLNGGPELSNTNQLNNVVGNTFDLSITDDNNCTLDTTVLIRDNNGFNGNIDSQSNPTCFGECDGSAVVSCDGTAPRYDFIWFDENANQIGNGNGQFTLCDGDYTVVITDMDNVNCADTLTFTLTEPEQLVNTISSDTLICIDGTAVLNASATGGTGAYDYFWIDAGVETNSQSLSVTPVLTSSYDNYVLDANGCSSDTLSVNVTVLDSLQITLSAADTVVCPGECIDFTSVGSGGLVSTYAYTWNSNTPETTGLFNYCPTGTETVTVVLNDGCETPTVSAQLTVRVFPFYYPDLSYASGCSILDSCIYEVSGSDFNVLNWTNMQTGETYIGDTICFVEDQAGTYSYMVDFETTDGCTGATQFDNVVTVYPRPLAVFSLTKDTISVENYEYAIINNSEGAQSYQWIVDTLPTSNEEERPYFNFYDYGWHEIQLVTTSEYGCLDTTEQYIFVQEDLVLYVPNAFSPDGVGTNNTFFPKGIGVRPGTFEMYIYDRWGNLIYKGNDIYVWLIKCEDYFDKKYKMVGHVSLIR